MDGERFGRGDGVFGWLMKEIGGVCRFGKVWDGWDGG